MTGAIGGLAGLVLVLASPHDLASFGNIGNLRLDRVGHGVGLLSLLIGVLQVVAGILVLRLSNAGRVLGITLAILGVLGGLGALGSGAGVVGIGLNGFVLYALIASGPAFRREGSG